MTDFSELLRIQPTGHSTGAKEICSGGGQDLFPTRHSRSGAAPMLFVESIGSNQLDQLIAPWTNLAERALEPNIFFHPAFMLPALTHVTGPQNLKLLLAWEKAETTTRGRLLALWPVVDHGGLAPSLTTWRHDYCCLGAPLLDRAQAWAGLDAIVRHLRADGRRAPIVGIEQLRRDGPFFSLVTRYIRQQGLEIEFLAQYERAVLDVTRGESAKTNSVSSKKGKELRRQSRRLHERGSVSFGVAEQGDALNRQIEAFLALEAKGWKGKDGGAFLRRPERAAFLRIVTRMLGHSARCRIYWLACNENIIASNIIFIDNGIAYFWKTAYDEKFAALSPGVQLTLQMTDSLLNEPKLKWVDSCAIPQHPMINHIWRTEEPFVDILFSCRRGRDLTLRGIAWRERLHRSAHETIKSFVAKARTK